MGRLRSGAKRPSAWSFCFSFSKATWESADALQFDGADDELVLAAGFIDGEIALQHKFVAVFEEFAMGDDFAAKEDAAELGARVFQGEINVTRALGAKICDFTGDPNLADFLLEEATNFLGEFGHGEDIMDCLRGEEFPKVPLGLNFPGHGLGGGLGCRFGSFGQRLGNALNTNGFSSRIDFHDHALQQNVFFGDGKALRGLGAEAFYDGFDLAAEHGLMGTCEADIGQVSGPAGENLFVGGLHVGVGAKQGADLAIEQAAHGDFFGGRLGMEIDDDDGGLSAEAGDLGLNSQEGILQLGHENAALQVEHGKRRDTTKGINTTALARNSRGVIEGANKARLGLQ